MLGDHCYFEVLDEHHSLKVVRSSLVHLHGPAVNVLPKSTSSTIAGKMQRAKLLSAGEITMLDRHNHCLSTMPSRDTRFIDLFHCVKNYAFKFEREYDVPFLQARTFVIAREVQWPRLSRKPFSQSAVATTASQKSISKTNDIFIFVIE